MFVWVAKPKKKKRKAKNVLWGKRAAKSPCASEDLSL